MKHPFCFLLFFILIYTSTISSGLSSSSQDKSAAQSPLKKYKVHFLSLKRGHKIASSYFTLQEQNKLEVNIPGEELLESKGDYTKNGLQFRAHFEGTIIKQKKHYHYKFTFNGLSLLDTYIAGTMVLNESIQETLQDQEITFLFICMPEEDETADNNKRSLFPF